MTECPDGALASAFAAAMDRLGPFEAKPALAVAVSGGGDSMALAVLARDWAVSRFGCVVGLIVDHGLRSESAAEAEVTLERLGAQGIPARILRLGGLRAGPALAERARIARYDALGKGCAEAGILHLLLGHHAGDQVETLAMRVLRGSGTHGLAGMAALRETVSVRLLRPLLGTEPGALRDLLSAAGIAWVEDPSNRDLRALRPRLRHRFASTAGTGIGGAMAEAGRRRSADEAATAAELAVRAIIRPEGFALLSPGRVGVGGLRALIQTISGSAYAPAEATVAELAARPRPATLAGVRLLPAGRLGEGMLVVREESAVGGPVPAEPHGVWDGRFRLIARGVVPQGATIGKLGADAARFRRQSALPAAVLRTLPAIRLGEKLVSVPLLGYGCGEDDTWMTLVFSPGRAAAGPCFRPAA